MNLLEKNRKLNVLLQKAGGHAVNFMEMADVLKDTILSNVYVISRRGKILGHSIIYPTMSDKLYKMVYEDKRISEKYNDFLMTIKETALDSDLHFYDAEDKEEFKELFDNKYLTLIPIIGAKERLGTLVLVRLNEPFVDDDLILAEYGSTIIGMEILREKTEEIEKEARNRAIVHVAVSSLSYSELESAEHIFEELDGKEGLLIASKIADRAGITRSVIVNALRKLESAGVIETKSLGMKGTYIRILNMLLVDELKKARNL
ncbi:GTP-sensing pleiotropic transcriptional regulator CodY [Longirhabdus pacifica]|uniref:GTP-sensing pleiotropic transcriptional regulator CodY n=1 Tax=Longirhabdus pacifica TaxID=2305227 RepID=UPI0010086DFB|nr:GTP-sensing pleiotropic transcriptional regulator CodY [Longirhabdus pacifica]